jgi:hypothetical protein
MPDTPLRIDCPRKNLVVGLHIRPEKMGELTVFVDQVLAEIPSGRLAVPAVLSGIGEPTVKGILVGAFHAYFFEHGKRDAEIFVAKTGDVLGTPGFLARKIIAWKTEYHHAVFVFAIKFFPKVVLTGKTAVGCYIHNDHFFAPKLIQRHRATIEPDKGKTKKSAVGTAACRYARRAADYFAHLVIVRQIGESEAERDRQSEKNQTRCHMIII